MNITDSEIMGGVGFGYDQYQMPNIFDDDEFAFSEVLDGPRIQRRCPTTPVGKLSRCKQEQGQAPSFTIRKCSPPRKICQVEPSPVVRRTYHTCKEKMTPNPTSEKPDNDMAIPQLGITTNDLLILLFIFLIIVIIVQMYNTNQICNKIRKMMKVMKKS